MLSDYKKVLLTSIWLRKKHDKELFDKVKELHSSVACIAQAVICIVSVEDHGCCTRRGDGKLDGESMFASVG